MLAWKQQQTKIAQAEVLFSISFVLLLMLQPGEFVHTIGDAHVYLNHVDALRQQLVRSPRSFPTLGINPDKTDIDSFDFSDFTVSGYDPYPTIKMDMAV